MNKYVLRQPTTVTVADGTVLHSAKVYESLGDVDGVEESGMPIGWRNFSSAKQEGAVLTTTHQLKTSYKKSKSEEGIEKGWVVSLARTDSEIIKEATLLQAGGWDKMKKMILAKGEASFASVAPQVTGNVTE